MADTTAKNALRALLPDASDAEIQAAEERFRRYLRLAIEIVQSGEERRAEAPLTQSHHQGNVNPGKVDPAQT